MSAMLADQSSLAESALGALVGHSPAMQRLRSEVWQAATGDEPVVVHGETGSGKELVA